MNTQTKAPAVAHTPEPWTLHELDPQANGELRWSIGVNGPRAYLTADADTARLITNYINDHPKFSKLCVDQLSEITALREALANLVATARTFRNVPKEDQEWTSIDDTALDAAFAALAKTKGTT